MIKIILVILLLFWFTHSTFSKNLYRIPNFPTGLSNKFILKYNAFVWISIVISIILIYFEKYLWFTSFLVLSMLASVYFIFMMKDEYSNFIYNFYFWLLYTISCMVLIGIIGTIFYVHRTHDIKRKKGPRGYLGERGDKGNNSEELKDVDVCHQQLIMEATNVYNDYVEKYKLEKPELMDQINNIYLKDNFKRICMSNEFKKSQNEIGIVKTIYLLKDKVRLWTIHILNYKRGKFFLEDYVSNAYTWTDELLYNSPTLIENESPFIFINKFNEWNWGNCHKK